MQAVSPWRAAALAISLLLAATVTRETRADPLVMRNQHPLLAPFGLPSGDRPLLPRDQLLLEYRRGNDVLLRVDESGSAIGDMPLSLGAQIAASDAHALAAWLTFDLPTGKTRELTGNGALDVALSLAAESRFADRWQVFAQLGAARLGHGELLAQLQKEFVWCELAGISWNAWRTFDLTVQLEANSRVFGTPDKPLAGKAVVLSYGGSYRSPRGWRFDLGMSEDIDVGASPDVVFDFALRRDF